MNLSHNRIALEMCTLLIANFFGFHAPPTPASEARTEFWDRFMTESSSASFGWLSLVVWCQPLSADIAHSRQIANWEESG